MGLGGGTNMIVIWKGHWAFGRFNAKPTKLLLLKCRLISTLNASSVFN